MGSTLDGERDDYDGEAAVEFARLVGLAYQELRSIAHRHLATQRTQRDSHETIETTGLVHEAFLKLAAGESNVWRDSEHVRAVASLAMRHILVDRARARETRKHGGGLTRVTFDLDRVAAPDEPINLFAIDAAIDRLAKISPRLARVVALRFHGALSDTEIASALGITIRTVQRDWLKARILLERALDA